MIQDKPKNIYNPKAANELLAVAETYLDHADRLIYSYGSKTFLSGYALYDNAYDGRGNIDCSTFLLLVLAGIPYEASPYSTGSVDGLKPGDQPWVQTGLVDFSELHRTYTSIAERIGRPYLECPKGLDLEKAAAMGISIDVLGDEIRNSGALRRSTAIAQHYIRNGDCFSDPAYLRPGDIVFYRSAEFFKERKDEEAQIVHVGIVAEDTTLMFNSSGYLSKEKAAAEGLPAVALSPVFGRRAPSFFARPDYGRKNSLETRRLTDFAQIKMLYESQLKKDFVRNELKPLASMKRSWEKGSYDCYGLFDGTEILGYAFYVRLGNDYLLDYLAITDDHRGQGLGSVFLRQLADCMADAGCVIVEVEDPDRAPDEETRALRERRLQFYLRSGYLTVDVTSSVFGVAYRLLEFPATGSHSTEKLRSVYTAIYRDTLPAVFFRTQFQVF